MPGKFQLKTARNGQVYFNLMAANGQVILTSETYTSLRGARNGIESVRRNAADENRYEKKTQRNGKFFFVLKSGNQQVIGKSQAYETEAACKAGIRSVMKTAPGAVLEMADGKPSKPAPKSVAQRPTAWKAKGKTAANTVAAQALAAAAPAAEQAAVPPVATGAIEPAAEA